MSSQKKQPHPDTTTTPAPAFKLDLDKVVNKTRLARSKETAAAGFPCAICSLSFTAYDAYLDHRNSKAHRRNAGLPVEIERVDDVERIRARLALLKERRSGGGKVEGEEFERKIEERIRQRRLEEEERRAQRKRASRSKQSQK